MTFGFFIDDLVVSQACSAFGPRSGEVQKKIQLNLKGIQTVISRIDFLESLLIPGFVLEGVVMEGIVMEAASEEQIRQYDPIIKALLQRNKMWLSQVSRLRFSIHQPKLTDTLSLDA